LFYEIFHPRLAPLRQAQGKQWAAFLRRFAAGTSGAKAPITAASNAALKRRSSTVLLASAALKRCSTQNHHLPPG